MKKIIVPVALLILVSFQASAQLNLIDDIVSKLIPGITNGIKDVIQSNRRGKVDTAEVGKLQRKVNIDLESFYAKVNADQANIDFLNKVFEKTLVLSGPVTSMQTICMAEILRELDANSNENLNRAIVRRFLSNWSQFKNQIKDLSEIIRAEDNAHLQVILNNFSIKIGTSLKSLDSYIANKSPNIKSEFNEFIKDINSSEVRSMIDSIQIEITNLHIALTSYISAFSVSLQKAKATKP